MRVFSALLSLVVVAARLPVHAVPTTDVIETHAAPESSNPTIDVALAANEPRAPRFSCGQYKFNDGTVQEFYSQVWAGIPADRVVCHQFKYEFRDKKGQDGVMVAAKVDPGCTCFFYETPCDPDKGLAERWEGWAGWQNYASTDKKFKGWYCFERN